MNKIKMLNTVNKSAVLMKNIIIQILLNYS